MGGGEKEVCRFRLSRMCQALPTHIRGAQVSMQPRGPIATSECTGNGRAARGLVSFMELGVKPSPDLLAACFPQILDLKVHEVFIGKT